MTWPETHRRWQLLREVENEAARDLSGDLPWRPEYAEVFGDQAGLLRALRYHWDLTVQAQLDTHLDEVQLEERRRELHRRYAGVLRILDRQAGLARVTGADRVGG